MSEQEPIKPGDVVTLKSGGPAMTVTQVNDAKSFECMWFEDKYLHKNYFKTVALKLHKDEPVGAGGPGQSVIDRD